MCYCIVSRNVCVCVIVMFRAVYVYDIVLLGATFVCVLLCC